MHLAKKIDFNKKIRKYVVTIKTITKVTKIDRDFFAFVEINIKNQEILRQSQESTNESPTYTDERTQEFEKIFPDFDDKYRENYDEDCVSVNAIILPVQPAAKIDRLYKDNYWRDEFSSLAHRMNCRRFRLIKKVIFQEILEDSGRAEANCQ